MLKNRLQPARLLRLHEQLQSPPIPRWSKKIGDLVGGEGNLKGWSGLTSAGKSAWLRTCVASDWLLVYSWLLACY